MRRAFVEIGRTSGKIDYSKETTFRFSKGVSLKALSLYPHMTRLNQAVRCFNRAMRRYDKRLRSDRQSHGGRDNDHIGELRHVRRRALDGCDGSTTWCREWGAGWFSQPTVRFIWSLAADACDKLAEAYRQKKLADDEEGKKLANGWSEVTFAFGTVTLVNNDEMMRYGLKK